MLNLKGNFPYKMKGFDPAIEGPSPASAIRITTTELCTSCGLCAENCPWGVIDKDNPGTINYSGCMRCLRCVRICPAAAKRVDDKLMTFVPQFEARLNAQRKEPELFLMH
jgi:ferredoxin